MGTFPKGEDFKLIDDSKRDGVFFISGDVHFGEITRYDCASGYPLYDITSSGLTQAVEKAVLPPLHFLVRFLAWLTPSTLRVMDKSCRSRSCTYGQPNFGAIEINWDATPVSLKIEVGDANGFPVMSVNTTLLELRARNSKITVEAGEYQKYCSLEVNLPWIVRYRLVIFFFCALAVVSVGAALFLFQQLAGINAVVYYSTSVFRSVGIASDVAASALVGASNVFGTTIASSLMDKQGRKSLLMTSFAGMAASMLLLSLSLTWTVLAPYAGILAVLGTVLYVLSFSLGAGPVPALLLPEIFASRIRAKAVALSLGMHWISNFVIGLYFLSVVNKFGISSVYLGFSMVCLLAVIYIASNVVETKGRSLSLGPDSPHEQQGNG